MIRAPISSARSTWWRSPSGKRNEREHAAGLRSQAQGLGPLKANRAVFAFDPHRFKADLRRQRDEQGRGAIDGDAADPARATGRV